MKASLIFSLIFFSSVLFSQASEKHTEKSSIKRAFQDGEELTYILKYGPIHGGMATLSIKNALIDDRQVYHAKARARSIGLTDKIYRIDDVYESYFDHQTGLPYKAIRNISEGGYKFYNEVYFDHEESIVTSQRSGEVEVPENILDMVSTLYYLRNLDLEDYHSGDVIDITTYFGDEIFHLPLRYRGKERVKTKLGKIKCYRFDPVVEVGRVFESEDDMTVWITADENKIPFLIRFDMIIGAVKCELNNYSNLSRPFALEK